MLAAIAAMNDAASASINSSGGAASDAHGGGSFSWNSSWARSVSSTADVAITYSTFRKRAGDS